MRERDLQRLCRRALLLTVCMLSLWGQLTSASSHRSHIGTRKCTRSLGVCLSGAPCSGLLLQAKFSFAKKARIKSDFSCSFIHSYFFFLPLITVFAHEDLRKRRGAKKKKLVIYFGTQWSFFHFREGCQQRKVVENPAAGKHYKY